MSGSEQFWATGTWFFLFYGFVVLAVAGVRAARMERRYRRANSTDDRAASPPSNSDGLGESS